MSGYLSYFRFLYLIFILFFADNDIITDENDSERKPSYVGLSCAVSGYSSFIRYTSPSRKNSPPQKFHVAEPQMLDFNNLDNMRQEDMTVGAPVRGQINDQPDFYHSSHTRKVVQAGGMTTVETVTKFYNNNNNNNLNGTRETSPGGSDTSSVGSGSGSSGGNLVQRQIERLYGGKMQTVRLTSPEPRFDDSSPESEYYRNRNNTNGTNDPLELKTLKVPAVFRLLRPEFREQLKSNSCQVKMPSEDYSGFRNIPVQRNSPDRIIPITVENNSARNGSTERIIPVTRCNEPFKGRNNTAENFAGRIKTDITATPVTSRVKPVEKPAEKPALPAKPMSPTRNARSPVAAPRLTSRNEQPTDLNRNNGSEFSSPALVSSVSPLKESKTSSSKSVSPVKNGDFSEHNNVPMATNGTTIPECKVPSEDNFPEPEDLEELDQYPCGIRERSLLCPIQEEDTESTASGSSVSVKKAVMNTEDSNVILEEIHDGHYFIRVREKQNLDKICLDRVNMGKTIKRYLF